MRSVAYSLSLSSLLILPTFIVGCTLQTTAAPNPVSGTTISGIVHGGQQPIAGAKVYLLAVNPTGYGGPGIAASAANASISLLNPASTGSPADSIGSYVLTGTATGGFTVSGDYSCTSGFAQSTGSAVALSGTEQIYLYILGGTVFSNSSSNAASGLLVALGPCNNPTSKVTVNEVTTVATAYALSGFATDATHIGSSGTSLALTGLSNAFGSVANLTVASSGTAATATAGGNGTVPTATVYTLADILAACVNSTGSTASGSSCNTLFSYTKSAGASGTAPTDTATAAIDLAHNPWPTAAGMTALYGLVPSTGAPFVGGLSGTNPPNDFTLALKFTGGGLYDSAEVAIDGAGNVWATNSNNASINDVSELSGNGTPVSPSTGYTAIGTDPDGIAIDTSGYVWVANNGTNNVSKLSPVNGTAVGNSPFSGGGLKGPSHLAVDSFGNIWVTNYSTGIVSKLNGSTGVPYTPTGYSDPNSLNRLLYIAVDPSDTIWTSGYEDNIGSISSLTEAGAISPDSPYSLSGGDGPLAVDSAGSVWIAGSASVSKLTVNGSAVASSTFTGGGLCSYCSNGIAVDGAGNIWVSDGEFESPYEIAITALNNSGTPLSPPTGYTTSLLNYPLGLAVDGSGNVGVSDNGGPDIVEFVGAAVPVVTPIAAGVANNTLGTRP